MKEFKLDDGEVKWLLATGDMSELLWLAPNGCLTDSCYDALHLNTEQEAIRINMLFGGQFIIEDHIFY